VADLAIAIKIATEDQSSGPIGKIKGALGGLGEVIAAPTRALGGLVSGLGQLGLAAQGVQAVMGAAQGVGNLFGIGALNELEQTRASFMAFTKDAAKTEELLAGVRKEAALTPFAFGEMAKATASLLPVAKSSGVGIEDLRKQAEILAASNPMEGLEGASFSLREAMTGDFTSIIERFNLSRSSINKWKEEGVPNIEIVRRAMAEMGFDSDLIAAKAETLDGRWSTFQDTLVTLQTKMGQPIFDAMKEGLIGLQGVLDSNMASFEAFADWVAGGLTSAIATGKAAIGTLVDAWSAIGESFTQGGLMGALRTIGPMLGTLLEGIGNTIAGAVEGWASAFAAWVDGAEGDMMGGLAEMAQGLYTWIGTAAAAIIDKLALWAGAFVDWIGPKIPGMLQALGGYLSEMTGWMLGTALPAVVGKLAEWGLALVSWIAPRIPPLLLELGKLLLDLGGWIIGTALPAILVKLAEWGLAFVAWVAPQIPPLLQELGSLLVDVGSWLIGTALPAIVAKLGEWATAFVAWVAPEIPNLVLELAKLQVRLLLWVGEQVDGIVTKLGEWGAAFVDWIAKDVLPPLPEKLGAILTALTGWVGEKLTAFGAEAARLGVAMLDGLWTADSWTRHLPTKLLELLTNLASWVGEKLGQFGNEAARLGVALLDGLWTAASWSTELPGKLDKLLTETGTWITGKLGEFGEQAKAIGSGILKGVQDGISGALGGFWDWLQREFVDKIPSFVKNILGIQSPSRVMFDIGVNMVEGLRLGLERRLPSVEDVIQRAIGNVGQMSGAVDDWLKAAISYTGVGMDWLPGLRWIVGHESGGNPRAKNPDSTASGLFQIIDSTWASSRDPKLPNDIFNPVINAIAGIRYIADRYGDPDSAIAFWRKNNYYGDGGWITEPVVGVGLRSRQGYVFGERGEDEMVTPRSRLGSPGRGGGDTYNVTVNGAGLEEIPALVVRKLRHSQRMLPRRRD
jgi:SLT domain-containing protein